MSALCRDAALCGALSSLPVRSQTQSFEGKPIVEIQFDPHEQPVAARTWPRRHLEARCSPAPGGCPQVNREPVRHRALPRHQVDAEPQAGGVVVRFITKNSWFVGRVSVTGKVAEPPNRGQMSSAAGVNLGEPFHEDSLPQAQAGVHALLVSDGYYESRVTQRIDYDAKTQQAHIEFVVESGPRARYRTPVLLGDLKMAVDTIVAATRFKRRWIGGWHIVTQNRTRDALGHVRQKYEKQERLLATVQLDSLDYDHDTRLATPTLRIDAGPLVDVKPIGAKVSNKTMRQNVPVYEEHTVDRDLLVEGQRNLQDAFQAAGYFEADVEFKQQRLKNDREEIDYLINLGRRHRFVSLQIQGNHYFRLDTFASACS